MLLLLLLIRRVRTADQNHDFFVGGLDTYRIARRKIEEKVQLRNNVI